MTRSASPLLELLLSFFGSTSQDIIEHLHGKLLKKYENQIDKVVNSKIYADIERKDCKQFVCICLCKLYKSRYKYNKNGKGDWDNVVRATIKRRVDDYRKKLLRYNNRYYTECRLSGGDTEYDIEVNESVSTDNDNNDQIEGLLKLVKSNEEFDEWDIELVETMIEMSEDDENFTIKNIMYWMGYRDCDRSKFSDSYNEFRQKMENHKDNFSV